MRDASGALSFPNVKNELSIKENLCYVWLLKEFYDLLREYASLAGKEDEKSEARKTEILNYIKLNADDSFREEAEVFINQKIDQLQSEVQTLREQLAKEDYKLLPLRYIAQEYFGKSAAWLSQRLNGSEVRGHVYTLNSEQKDIFNRAVQEIGQRISSLQLT